MSAWSSRRKSIYALIVVVAGVVLIGIPAWKIFYTAPSCTDNSRNGDEQGIDCGGSCTKLCQNAFLPLPSASWVRFRETAPRTYNVAAYIVNPNQKAGAEDVPYKLVFIDKGGLEIGKHSGVFDVSPGRNTMIFATNVRIAEQVPARASLEFDKEPEWAPGNDPLAALEVSGKDYKENAAGSSLDATVRNRSALSMRDVTIYAILTDKDGNVIDFSKTIVDEIVPQGTALAPFTWPYSHEGKVISLEVLAVPE